MTFQDQTTLEGNELTFQRSALRIGFSQVGRITVCSRFIYRDRIGVRDGCGEDETPAESQGPQHRQL